jgi:hypothetical protein
MFSIEELSLLSRQKRENYKKIRMDIQGQEDVNKNDDRLNYISNYII